MPSSFRIVRGQVPLELLAASLEADLLILGRASQPLTRRMKAGSTARLVALQASRTVLLTKPVLRPKQSVMVAFDGSELGWRALTTAVPLTQPDQTLIILLINGSPAQQEQWRRDTAIWLQQRRIKLEYRYLPQATPYQFAQIAHNTQCSLLILSETVVGTSKDTLYALLDLIDCSLMFVR